MPWQKQYDKTEVLERAMMAFWARGYAGTSMSDLVAATGIHRGSIYAEFSDKRTLFIEALHHYDRHYRANYLNRIAGNPDARAAILAAFDGAAQAAADGTRPRGCLLVNTALELSPHDPEVRALVNASLEKVEAFFLNGIEAAKRQGTVSSTICSRTTAKALLGLFLGLRVLTRSDANESALDAIISQAKFMLR